MLLSLSLLVRAGFSPCSLLANPTEPSWCPGVLKAPGPLDLSHVRGEERTWSEFQHVSSSWSNRCFFPNSRVLRFRTELTLEAPESGRGEGLDPALRAQPPPARPSSPPASPPSCSTPRESHPAPRKVPPLPPHSSGPHLLTVPAQTKEWVILAPQGLRVQSWARHGFESPRQRSHKSETSAPPLGGNVLAGSTARPSPPRFPALKAASPPPGREKWGFCQ